MMLQYMISEMKQAGNWPQAMTYSYLMDGYAMVNQPHKASQVMQDCIEDGHKVMGCLCCHCLPFSNTVPLSLPSSAPLPFSLLSSGKLPNESATPVDVCTYDPSAVRSRLSPCC